MARNEKPKKLQKLRNQLDAIKQEIKSLETFRQTKQTRLLLRHLFGENSHILNEIRKLQLSSELKQKEQQQRKQKANQNRRVKMTRSWRFFKAVKENFFPDKSVKEIRSDYSKFMRGLEIDVSDIVWKNPSP